MKKQMCWKCGNVMVILRTLLEVWNQCNVFGISTYHYHDNVDDSVVDEFYRKRAIGVKWPGIIPCTAEYWDNLAESVNCSGDKIAFWRAKPEFGHCTDIEQLIEELEAVGFDIRRAKECQHTGYPACVRNNGRANIQIIVRKPMES